jgi:hypothetical protein
MSSKRKEHLAAWKRFPLAHAGETIQSQELAATDLFQLPCIRKDLFAFETLHLEFVVVRSTVIRSVSILRTASRYISI